MRILMWTDLYWPHIGGIEVLGRQLVAELRQRGHEVIVVTGQAVEQLPDVDELDGATIHRFNFRAAMGQGDVESFVRLRRGVAALKQQFAPDVIHLNGVGPSVLFHLATKDAYRAPVLTTMQQNIQPTEPTGPQSVMGRTLREADWVSCVSDELLEQVHERVPEVIGRSSTIYNVLQLPEVTPQPLPFDPPVFLCLGRICADKRFNVAVDALAQIAGEYPDFRVLVAGDGDQRAALEAQVARLDLSERVEFCGWVPPDDVPQLINRCTALLMPSRREGLPLVGVQAMMMGRPIIGSRTTGLTEIIVDGQTGSIVAVDDTDGFAAALRATLANPEATQRQGKAARQRALELFDWNRAVNAYCDRYRHLIEEFTHGRVAMCAS
ncbi:MAG: glycosyltransferase family 1 protein [Planctomycetota bacterium]|nr:MAG: glycosyltransferase family 1 protein [Planctomycetota bacterium]REJ90398.1 MAG: glycosyltransferase family 1 protein [Planctomycetota bacterium]